jgi:PEP-CTERM motif
LRNRTLLLFVVAMFTTVGQVSASMIVSYGNIPQSDENVLFNQPGLISSGMTVLGTTNTTSTLVDFIGQETLITPANGQARIEAAHGSFNDLLIRLHAGGTFQSIIFNIDAQWNGRARFTLNDSQIYQWYELDRAGENFFTIRTTGADRLGSVRIQTTTGMDEVRQIRIGGASAAVPEPSSFVLMGAGLIAMSFLVRRVRK